MVIVCAREMFLPVAQHLGRAFLKLDPDFTFLLGVTHSPNGYVIR
jgi:hypothetical protein